MSRAPRPRNYPHWRHRPCCALGSGIEASSREGRACFDTLSAFEENIREGDHPRGSPTAREPNREACITSRSKQAWWLKIGCKQDRAQMTRH